MKSCQSCLQRLPHDPWGQRLKAEIVVLRLLRLQCGHRYSGFSVATTVQISVLPLLFRLLCSYCCSDFSVATAVQVLLWINQNFLLVEDLKAEGSNLDVRFICLRDLLPLFIQMESSGQVSMHGFLDEEI